MILLIISTGVFLLCLFLYLAHIKGGGSAFIVISIVTLFLTLLMCLAMLKPLRFGMKSEKNKRSHALPTRVCLSDLAQKEPAKSEDHWQLLINDKAKVWLKEMLFIASVVIPVVVLAAVFEAFAQDGNGVSKFIGPLEFVSKTTSTRSVSLMSNPLMSNPALITLLGGLLYTFLVWFMGRKEITYYVQATAVGTWVICTFVMTVMGNSLQTPPDVFLLYVLAVMVSMWITDRVLFPTGHAAQTKFLRCLLFGIMVVIVCLCMFKRLETMETTLTESAEQKTFIPAWILIAGLAICRERMMKGQKGSATQKPRDLVWILSGYAVYLGSSLMDTLVMGSTESAIHKPPYLFWLISGVIVFVRLCLMDISGLDSDGSGIQEPPDLVWILSGYAVSLGPLLIDILVMGSTESAIHKPLYHFWLISGIMILIRPCLIDILGLESNGSGIQKPQHPVWILSGYAVSLGPWAVVILRMVCNGSTAQQGPDVAWILGGLIIILGQYIRDIILIKLKGCASQAPDPVCHLLFGTFRIQLGLWMMVVTGTQQNLDLILLYGGVGLAVLIRIYEKWFMKTEEEVLLRVTLSSWYYEKADFWLTMMMTLATCSCLLWSYMEVCGLFFLTWKWSVAVYLGSYNIFRNVIQTGYLTLFMRCLDTAATAVMVALREWMKLKERGIKQTNGLLRSFKNSVGVGLIAI